MSSAQQLERSLRNLARVGRRIDGGDGDQPLGREIWRFELDGKPYLLHFWPRTRSALTRVGRGNPALREFGLLQALQKSRIPSPRASTVLIGFRLDSQLGDALIVESIEPARQLDELLAEHYLRGQRVPNHYELARQLTDLVQQIGRAGFGHERLELGRFLVSNGKLYLADVEGLRRGGLRARQVLRLAHSARHYVTRQDILRAWQTLGDAPLPSRNRVGRALARRFDRSVFRENEHFGRLSLGAWRGVFTRRSPHPLRWSAASQSRVRRADWERAWRVLLGQIDSDALELIKRDDSGDVLRAQVVLDGRPIDAIVKRPRRKRWHQPLIDLGRRSRAARTWHKTWQMLVRDVPTEFPMLLMERSRFGYTVDSVLVFERVPGVTLAAADLDALAADARRELFRRAGRLMRTIDDLGGFTHSDAKSTNWIVFADPVRGPTPVLIDLYGIRRYNWSMLGMNRLLRAMRQHPQYTPDDSYHLCKGYAPEARVVREGEGG